MEILAILQSALLNVETAFFEEKKHVTMERKIKLGAILLVQGHQMVSIALKHQLKNQLFVVIKGQVLQMV